MTEADLFKKDEMVRFQNPKVIAIFGSYIGVPFHNKCIWCQLIKKKSWLGQTRDKGDPQKMKSLKMFYARSKISTCV